MSYEIIKSEPATETRLINDEWVDVPLSYITNLTVIYHFMEGDYTEVLRFNNEYLSTSEEYCDHRWMCLKNKVKQGQLTLDG